jgi:hypothetical protein
MVQHARLKQKLLIQQLSLYSNVQKITFLVKRTGPVLNAENIKADRPKILRPTHFSCMKDIKADSFLALTNIKADMFKSGE